MGGIVLVVRLLLAAAFVLAATAKLRQWRSVAETMKGLGVPGPLARWGWPLVPAVELALAAALVAATTAVAGAVAALAVLAVFTAVLAGNLARGRRPACNCFGTLTSEPISAGTLARNAVLLALAAGVAASDGGPSLPTVAREAGVLAVAVVAGYGVLVGALLAQGAVTYRLLGQHGRLLLRIDALEGRALGPATAPAPAPAPPGLRVGTPAPEFTVAGVHGETMTLSALLAAGKPVLLVFSDPACGPCTTLAPSLAAWQRDHAERLRLVVVAAGDPEVNRAKAAEHGLIDVFVQTGHEVADAYRYGGTPGAVLIDLAGRVAAPLATGAPAIEALVDRVSRGVPVEIGRRPGDGSHAHHHGAPAPAPLEVGGRAPAFRLPTVGGGEADLAEFRGRPLVVLFWDPRCGFCERLLPELLAWEQARTATHPELLVVSTGDEAANAASGFASTVFLDATRSTMAAYGATGTPMAVAIDADGRVAGPLGVGADGVRPLLADTTTAATDLQEIS